MKPAPARSLIRRIVEATAPGAVSLALGAPAHPVPAAVKEALAEAVRAGDFGYTPNAGLPELRRAVAARFPEYGGEAAAVLITVGSQEALAVAIEGLIEPGDEVILPRRCYPSYPVLVERAGGRPVRADLEAGELPLSGRTRAILAGAPANPTGKTLSAPAVARLVAAVERAGGHLVWDGVYADLCFGPAPAPRPAGDRVVHVGGVSKSLAVPGLRLGWLAAAPPVVERLLGLHQHLVTCAPILSQKAALAGESLPPEVLAGVRDFYRRRWQRLRGGLERLPGVRWLEPAGAFYAYVDFRQRIGAASEAFAFRLAREGRVAIVPGEAFGPGEAGWARLSFATGMDALDLGIERLSAALEEQAE